MLALRKNKKILRIQNGTSMLELAIAMPVMLVLLMGVVDLGLALNQYLTITRATYEGLRYGASLYDNKPGCNGPECQSPSDNSNTNLNDMGGRIKMILGMQGYSSSNVTLQTVEATTMQSDVEHTFNVIKATVEVPFHGLLPFFKMIPIRATITFTDLYKDKTAGNYEDMF